MEFDGRGLYGLYNARRQQSWTRTVNHQGKEVDQEMKQCRDKRRQHTRAVTRPKGSREWPSINFVWFDVRRRNSSLFLEIPYVQLGQEVKLYVDKRIGADKKTKDKVKINIVKSLAPRRCKRWRDARVGYALHQVNGEIYINTRETLSVADSEHKGGRQRARMWIVVLVSSLVSNFHFRLQFFDDSTPLQTIDAGSPANGRLTQSVQEQERSAALAQQPPQQEFEFVERQTAILQ